MASLEGLGSAGLQGLPWGEGSGWVEGQSERSLLFTSSACSALIQRNLKILVKIRSENSSSVAMDVTVRQQSVLYTNLYQCTRFSSCHLIHL